MKRNLLFVLALATGMTAVGQSTIKVKNSVKATPKWKQLDVLSTPASTKAHVAPVKYRPVTKHTVDVVDLGTAGNVFSSGFQHRTNLWYDPTTDVMSFIHRADPTHADMTSDLSTGFYRFDYSTDGGATWSVNQGPAYLSNGSDAPPAANARYPQAVHDGTHFSYYGPSLTATNGANWGGHVYGSIKFDGSGQTQTEVTGNRYLIPDDMTLSKTGKSYSIGGEFDLGATMPDYTDTITLSVGTWNAGTGEYDYDIKHLPFNVSEDNQGLSNFVESRIAMADNGTDGYIGIIGHSDFAIEPDSLFHLLIWKTVDGGDSWFGPTEVLVHSLDAAITNTWSKTTIGFNMDMAVDKNGNLHCVVPVSVVPANPWAFATDAGYWGLFDVYTTDKGATWMGKLLGKPMTFRGTFGLVDDSNNPEVPENNRQAVSRNWDGDKLFFTWFDTDTNIFYPIDQAHANMNPDMYCIGYDVDNDKWTDVVNMTAGTNADGFVTYGNMSYYVKDDGAGTYELPCVYGEMTGADPTQTGSPLNYKYITGAQFTDADFTNANDAISLLPWSVEESSKNLLGLSSYPNPSNGLTTINIQLKERANVSLEIYDAVGKQVFTKEQQSLAAGTHTIEFDATEMSAGIYFYTLNVDGLRSTKKMIIQ